MDRRAREGRAKRRHCARHGEHVWLGPRDRRDVWDRPRFQGRSARRLDRARAGRTIARPAPSPRSVRTRLTARDRQTSQAGPPPEKTITLASLIAPRLVRRVASKSVASSEARAARRDRLLRSLAKPPHPTRDARATAASFSSKNPPERLPARRVASRDAPSPPDCARPREPPVKLHMSLLCRPFVFSSSSPRSIDRADPPRGCRRFPCVRRPAFAEPDFARRRLAPRAAGSDSSSPRRSPPLSSSIPFSGPPR